MFCQCGTNPSDRNVNFSTTFPPAFLSNTTTTHRTFLDTVGRPTLKLTALNVADEVRENVDLIVTYDYPWIAGYRKPITIAAGILAVFVASWVVGGLDLRIGRQGKGK